MTNIVTLIVTAYCHCSVCCGTSGQPTASGKMPRAGVTVAASRTIPFGTTVLIPSLNGKRIVQDRLAKRYDNRVDIFMSTHDEAKKWGKQILPVTFITK